jgi:molecular chaperone GrpE (heat shock protein)
MDEQNAFNTLDDFLGRFDFAAQLAAVEGRGKERFRAHLLALLEVQDSMDRVLAAADGAGEKSPRFVQSLRLVQKQLEKVLLAAGVEPTECLGSHAEPDNHEIVEVQEVTGAEHGQIVEQLLRGYRWEGAILRKPRVVVAHEERIE